MRDRFSSAGPARVDDGGLSPAGQPANGRRYLDLTPSYSVAPNERAEGG